MKIRDKLFELKDNGKAILATNFYNLETLRGILMAAGEINAPVILQLSKSSVEYMGLEMAARMARQGLQDFRVEGWLHLDHGDSMDLVKRCLEAGFDSVMIDASETSFEKNVEVTSQVVELAKKYGANVEAELGYVAKLGQTQTDKSFTQPEEAARYVELTGVDALAIAIGSAHGFYKEAPVLQIDLLERIHQATSAALVLHGSSGIPDDMLIEAINHGICKVNLATEIKDAFMKTLKKHLLTTDEIDLRKVFPVATKSVCELIKSKLLLLKSMKSEN
jgi:fructose-bisphosphate aldolase class II/tagatose 1,6-diphosphate aldolase GatY/KbaY